MCECRWQRVVRYPIGTDTAYTGDLLVERRAYHRWSSELCPADQRIVSAMQQKDVPRELHADLLATVRPKS